MAPDVAEHAEIRLVVLVPIGIVPEPHWHARERRRAHQFASLPRRRRTAPFVEYVHRHAQPAALQLAAPYGKGRIAEREAGHDVGAPADAAQLDVGLHALVHVVEAVAGEWAPGGEDAAQRREVVGLAGAPALLLGERDELGARAEHRDAFLLGHVPEHRAARENGRAVVQHDRGAQRERARQPVPHHPAAGGEVEHAVVAPDVHVQRVLLEMLEQRAPRPVHQALGQAGGARRIQDVQRMVERQPREGQRRRRFGRAHVVAPRDAARQARGVHGGVLARHQHHALDFRNARGDLADPRQAVDTRSCIAVRRRGQQHAGPDLPEPVEHAGHAEVGRAAGPDGPDAGRGEHQDHRLRHVGHERGHAVAGPDAVGAQRGGGAGHGLPQLAVGQGAGAPVLSPRDDGRMVVVVAQQILGEVELRAQEPGGAELRRGRRHSVAPDEHGVPVPVAGDVFGDHAAETPHRRPEVLAPLHRPLVERRVVGDGRPFVAHERQEAGEVRLRERGWRRGPEGCGHARQSTNERYEGKRVRA